MNMTKLKLKYCCYCGDLRTGSLVIAYLNLIRDIIITIISIIFLALTDTVFRSWIDRVMIPVFGILIAITLVNIVMDTILLIGIHKYKVGFLKTNYIFNVIEMVVVSIIVLALCITSGLYGLIPLCLVFLVFHVYNLLIIRSYYLKMEDPTNKPTIFDTYASPLSEDYIVSFKKEELES